MSSSVKENFMLYLTNQMHQNYYISLNGQVKKYIILQGLRVAQAAVTKRCP